MYKIILCFLFVLCACPGIGAAAPGKHPPEMSLEAVTFPKDTLTILTHKGLERRFTVEVATTRSQLAYGLMFRKSLPKEAGMLFLLPREQETGMWMKNTLIPLDMLFIDANGVIQRIEADTTPESLRSIRSGYPVSAVLELNAGISNEWGITVGDKVLFPAFSKKQP